MLISQINLVISSIQSGKSPPSSLSVCVSLFRSKLNNLNTGTLEDQLAEVIKQEKVIRDSRHDLDLVENLNKELEIVLVFDNMYTSHSALGLSQAWDGLLQMCGRLQRSLQSQIDARSRTGIPEERLQEWKEGFNHFDKVNFENLHGNF